MGNLRSGMTAVTGMAFALAVCLAIPGTGMAKKVNIKWWLGSAPGTNIWTELEKTYEKEHPNVSITTLSGDMDKFYTMVTAGMMPDIWGPYGTPGIKADVNRNWAAEITPYINRDAKSMDLNDFFPGMLREFRVNGKQYALPFINWEDYFLYNPVMYAEAGLNPPPLDSGDKDWNWDRMVANALKLTKHDASGRVTVAGAEFERTLAHSPAYMKIWNAMPYSDAALKSSVPQKIDYSSRETVTALTKVHDLIYKHKVASPGGMAIEGGKLGQQFNAGWRIQYVIPVKKAKWAIANLPWGVTNQGTMWPDGWRMSKVCKNKEEVWDFIKFLCSKRALNLLVTHPKSPFQGVPMARKSIFQESLGENIARMTGMKAGDVLRVNDQADAVNTVKYQETICIHMDLCEGHLDPIVSNLWSNKLSPTQTAAKLQEMTDKKLPTLFARWIRNIRFTGKEPR